MSLWLYRLADEFSVGRRPPRRARVHFHHWRVPNKRPVCQLGAECWPLNDKVWIVSDDRGEVNCGTCLRILGAPTPAGASDD